MVGLCCKLSCPIMIIVLYRFKSQIKRVGYWHDIPMSPSNTAVQPRCSLRLTSSSAVAKRPRVLRVCQ